MSYLLQKLSPEVVYAIVDELDTPRDFAALSAVCKAFKDAVSPGGTLGLLQCCHISVTLDNHAVFQTLASKPILARSVRKLVLADSPPQLRMGFWNGHKGHGSYMATDVIAAIRNMSRLEFLHLLISERSSHAGSILFSGLNDACPPLADVLLSTAGWHMTPEAAPQHNHQDSIVKEARGFRRFAWRSTLSGLATGSSKPVLEMLASRSPQLQHLAIRASVALSSFSEISFPSLVSFWIATSHELRPEDGPAFSTFVDRHPQIQELFFRSRAGDPQISLSPDALPNIRSLNMSLDSPGVIHFLIPLRSGRRRPLERLFLDDRCTSGLREICKRLPDITTLTTAALHSREHWHDFSLPSYGTYISKLLLNIECGACVYKSWESHMQGQLSRIKLFNDIRHLRFWGWHRDSERWTPAWEDYLRRDLGTWWPNLESIDNWIRQPSGAWRRKTDAELATDSLPIDDILSPMVYSWMGRDA